MALLYHQGRVGECDVTPEAYWTIADRCISKADALYLATITRAGGLLLGAAFAMVWRPYAVMRGPLRDKGRLLDLLAVVGLVALGAADVVSALRRRPTAPDPWLFRGGFLLTSIATLLRDRGGHAPWLDRRAGARQPGVRVGRRPVSTACTCTTGRSTRSSASRRQPADGRRSSPWRWWRRVVVTEAVVPVHRDADPQGRASAIWWRDLRRARDPVPRQLVTVAVRLVPRRCRSSACSAWRRADLQQNEIPESIDEDDEATGDVGAARTNPTVPPATRDHAPPTATTVRARCRQRPRCPSQQTTHHHDARRPRSPLPHRHRSPDLAIGDSVMLGAAAELGGRGIFVDAAVSRQMIDMIPVSNSSATTGSSARRRRAPRHQRPVQPEHARPILATLADVPRGPHDGQGRPRTGRRATTRCCGPAGHDPTT